jgi:outer membrane receptor protein involved in Fe transport
LPAAAVTNDLRFNYSRTEATGAYALDHFEGAAPLVSFPLPNPYDAQNADLNVVVDSLVGNSIVVGKSVRNVQRQFNIVDNLSLQRGSHGLKFGVDYRRLTPIFSPALYQQAAFFSGVSSASAGNVDVGALVLSSLGSTFLFRNLGVFAQDTWRIMPRLTMTYGVRWDVDFVPSTGFDLNDLSGLALAPWRNLHLDPNRAEMLRRTPGKLWR